MDSNRYNEADNYARIDIWQGRQSPRTRGAKAALRLKVLERRMAYLESKIDTPERRPGRSYDVQEYRALKWALDFITERL